MQPARTCLAIFSLCIVSVVAAEPETPPSLAAKYPGDTGIEKDPKVIFTENFDDVSADALKKRWESVKDPQIMSSADDVPAGAANKHSLLMTHIGGKGDGGALYRRLPKGQDQVYARFYIKFDPDCAPIHHFGTNMGGYNPTTAWPQGGAGLRADGGKGFWTGGEPCGKNWRWDFYAYWCEMRGSPPKGQTWGNSFIHDKVLNVTRGKWQCIEFMIKVNDVGQSNGETALWIAGEKVSHLRKGSPKGKWVFDKFNPGEGGEGVRWSDAKGGPEYPTVAEGGEPFEGFRWRTTPELNVNFIWTYLYITGAPK